MLLTYTIFYIRPDVKHLVNKVKFDDLLLAKETLAQLKALNCVIVETYNFPNN